MFWHAIPYSHNDKKLERFSFFKNIVNKNCNKKKRATVSTKIKIKNSNL